MLCLQRIKVSVGLNAGTGTAYFDGVQLEKGTSLSAYNLVENSSFERSSNYWTDSGNLSVNDGIDNTVSKVGQNTFKLTGEQGKNKYIKQRINISGDANTPLTLSGWSKQEGANPNGGYYSLQVSIILSDQSVMPWSFSRLFVLHYEPSLARTSVNIRRIPSLSSTTNAFFKTSLIPSPNLCCTDFKMIDYSLFNCSIKVKIVDFNSLISLSIVFLSVFNCINPSMTVI